MTKIVARVISQEGINVTAGSLQNSRILKQGRKSQNSRTNSSFIFQQIMPASNAIPGIRNLPGTNKQINSGIPTLIKSKWNGDISNALINGFSSGKPSCEAMSVISRSTNCRDI